jgi:hypothetical protein
MRRTSPIQARVASSIQSGSGPDIVSVFNNWAHLAKAVQGMRAEDAVRWAHDEIVKVYV